MVGTIYINQDLKTSVEKYLLKKTPGRKEFGGFFLGTNDTLVFPRFLPNQSNNPSRSYLTPKYWKKLIEIDLECLNFNQYFHFHTHPNHSFYSKQDLRVAHEKTYSEISFVLLYDKGNSQFTWRCYDSNFEEHYLSIIDENYKVFTKYFGNSLHLINLGQVFITRLGEIISSNPLSENILKIDNDFLEIYKFLEKRSNDWFLGLPSFTELEKQLNMSRYRIKNALLKIKNSGYFTKLLKNLK